jgi:hypothetical protein
LLKQKNMDGTATFADFHDDETETRPRSTLRGICGA